MKKTPRIIGVLEIFKGFFSSFFLSNQQKNNGMLCGIGVWYMRWDRCFTIDSYPLMIDRAVIKWFFFSPHFSQLFWGCNAQFSFPSIRCRKSISRDDLKSLSLELKGKQSVNMMHNSRVIYCNCRHIHIYFDIVFQLNETVRLRFNFRLYIPVQFGSNLNYSKASEISWLHSACLHSSKKMNAIFLASRTFVAGVRKWRMGQLIFAVQKPRIII